MNQIIRISQGLDGSEVVLSVNDDDANSRRTLSASLNYANPDKLLIVENCETDPDCHVLFEEGEENNHMVVDTIEVDSDELAERIIAPHGQLQRVKIHINTTITGVLHEKNIGPSINLFVLGIIFDKCAFLTRTKYVFYPFSHSQP